jgi:class 3 adenylate cyclase/Tfp pilus assembly protein PilF
LDSIQIELDNALEYRNTTRVHELLEELESIGTMAARAAAARGRGTAFATMADYGQALQWYRRSLDLYEQLGDRARLAAVIGNTGSIHRMTGDYPEALACHRRALTILEELGNKPGMARVTGNLAVIYDLIGDYPQALAIHRKALELHEECNDVIGVARVCTGIGIVFSSTGDHEQALTYLRRALAIHEEQGVLASVSLILGNMGIVYSSMERYEESLDHFHRAITMSRDVGNQAGVVHFTGSMVSALIQAERWDEAERALNEQATMAMDDPIVRVEHLSNRARVESARDNLDLAADLLHQALAMAHEAGLRPQEAEYNLLLRELALKRNDLAAYVKHNNEHHRITEEIRGRETTQKLAMMEAERRIDAERIEKERHRSLLYNTLPPDIADRVLRGEQVNDSFDLATVLFMDMVGFTTMSSTMHPNDVVRLLSRVFTTCDAIVAKHGLMKIKTIGDSYMAAGFPDPQSAEGVAHRSDVADRTARAALEIRHALSHEESHEVLGLRIGIHCGPVTAGIIGTERLQYDVWGDTVNVASRMESTGEPGRIQVSAHLVDHLTSGPWTIAERGTIDIKGKGAMTTYWLEER